MEDLIIPALGYASVETASDNQNSETLAPTSVESGPLIWDGEWDRSDSI